MFYVRAGSPKANYLFLRKPVKGRRESKSSSFAMRRTVPHFKMYFKNSLQELVASH